jgi:hypothetical protein
MSIFAMFHSIMSISVSIVSNVVLQILHRCCFTFGEVGADIDIGSLYVAIIVKVCEYTKFDYT